MHNLAITADGSVWSWGYGGDGRLAHGDDQAPVAAEEDRGLCWSARRRRVGWRWAHSLAVTADGAVWSWGFGEALTGQRVLAVSAGQYHGMVITAGGAL